MKKVVYSIILLAVIAVMYSCKVAPEKLATGTWKLDSVSVSNIDEVAKYYYDMDITYYDGEISSLVSQIQALDPKDKKNTEAIAQLDAQKKQLEDEKNALSVESTKESTLDSYSEMKGSSIVLNEDKTYIYTSFEYVENGTWTMAEDGLSINLVSTDGYEFTMLVQELTKEKMCVTYDYEESEGEFQVKSVFHYVK